MQKVKCKMQKAILLFNSFKSLFDFCIFAFLKVAKWWNKLDLDFTAKCVIHFLRSKLLLRAQPNGGISWIWISLRSV